MATMACMGRGGSKDVEVIRKHYKGLDIYTMTLDAKPYVCHFRTCPER